MRTSMRYLRFTLVLASVVLSSCTRVNANVQQTAAHGNDRIITREQLQGTATNVYDAVAKLRPQCLNARSGRAIGARTSRPDTLNDPTPVTESRSVTLYVDGVRTGTVSDLRSIPITDVLEVECLNAADAQQRFGLNNPSGAILLKTGKP